MNFFLLLLTRRGMRGTLSPRISTRATRVLIPQRGKGREQKVQLDERKQRILQAVIDDYISTASPVGSRTISGKYISGLSSATIRNEMSDLEELG